MLTKEQLAARLDGREYRAETTREDRADARAFGLVIVYGASDDLMEFRGAIDDETDGGLVHVDTQGVLDRSAIDDDDDDEIADYVTRKRSAKAIHAMWGAEPGYSWTYVTDIPHATFEIVEDGEPYCRGIVFALADLGGCAMTVVRFDDDQVEVTQRFEDAIVELMRSECEMMSAKFGDECWQWGRCYVSDLSDSRSLRLLYGGHEDRPDDGHGDFAVVFEVSP